MSFILFIEVTVGIALHFWLNLILTLFFFVPGVIHALWLVVKKVQASPMSPLS